MKIAVLSDSHDHIWNLDRSLVELNGKVGALIHCGDIIAPFSVAKLSTLDLPVYVSLGNNDEDHIAMFKKGNDKFTWVSVGQQFGEVELGDKKIAYTHYPKLGQLLAESGKYDAVFFGHTHKVENRKLGNTLLLNPGSVCGIFRGKQVMATYAIYDTKSNNADIIEINS